MVMMGSSTVGYCCKCRFKRERIPMITIRRFKLIENTGLFIEKVERNIFY
jgi:hypothetical protein